MRKIESETEASLAEGRWLWRRLYVFVASLGLWLLLRQVLGRVAPADLPRVADGLMGLMALMLVLYLVAPSAQQMIALLANLRLRLATGGKA